MTAAQSAPHEGLLLAGRYELTKPIASGGMAQVWEASDKVLGRTVAAKVLHPHLAVDTNFHRRFQREAIAAARLSHPAIVSIYDSVSEDGIEAIIMELVSGTTLRDTLDEQGRLPARDVLEIAGQVTQALQAAHEAGVVHRDVKPSNILLCRDRRVRVTDFGIAKAGEDTDLTQTGVLLGTAKYLSPEQVRGDDVDPRADLYSLGVVIFEALTGGPPFDAGSDYATAQARLFNPAPHLSQVRPDLPGELDQLISRLLQRDPDRRPATATDVNTALSAITIVSEELAGNGGKGDRTSALAPPPPSDTKGNRAPPPPGSSDARTGEVPGQIHATDLTDGSIEPEDELEDRRSLAAWLGPVLLLVLVGGSLVLAGILLTRSPGDSESSSEPTRTTIGTGADTTVLPPVEEFFPPVIVGASPFDPPPGDNEEEDALAPNAVDGDTSSFWSTENYSGPGFGRSPKEGVGLVIELERPSVLNSIAITTQNSSWAAALYFADARGEDLASWGEPAHQIGPVSGPAFVDLDNETATFVLLWITDHGLSNDGDEGASYADDNNDPDHRLEISEIVLE